ncbi:MAG: FadR/GntR family transcriptional regulator [Amaricoccus sp.]|uniref:FadR/GntR family transcriptional regulator n=1 Tax=Amaricoccus sp. TaxID=1872485 RepID=UPI0033161D1A
MDDAIDPSLGLIRVALGLHPLLTVRASKSQHDHALRALGLGMVSGEFAENEILPGDADLQRRLGVSRTVLREALKTLSAKGMVLAKAKTGTRVQPRRHWNFFDSDVLYWHLETGVDGRFLEHLSEMRLVFEPEAAALAAARRGDAHLAALDHWVGVMLASRAALSDFVEGDLRFHQTVADAAGNPLMRSIGSVIEVALAMTFAISSPRPDTEHDLTVARHRAVADAIRAGDADGARVAMRAVILEGLNRAVAQTGRR